jgi:hypothetical protein
MPQSDQPDKTQVEHLTRIVSQIVNVPTDDILRRDLAPNEFIHAHRLQELYRILAQVGVGVLPPAKLQALTQSANTTLQVLAEIKGLYPTSQQARAELTRRALVEYTNQFDMLSACIALFQVQAGGLESFRRSATETLEFITGVKAEGQASLDQLKSSIEVARQSAETSALSTYATYFDEESRSHRNSARGWLASTVALFGGTAGVAYWLWREFGQTLTNPDTLTTAQSVQLTVTKVVILSTIFTAAVASSRIYRSHLHNYVVNRHRRNALRTFQAFVNAPEADAQTKSAILLEATRCIFSQQPTGYISPEQESQPSQILEIVKQFKAQ